MNIGIKSKKTLIFVPVSKIQKHCNEGPLEHHKRGALLLVMVLALAQSLEPSEVSVY